MWDHGGPWAPSVRAGVSLLALSSSLLSTIAAISQPFLHLVSTLDSVVCFRVIINLYSKRRHQEWWGCCRSKWTSTRLLQADYFPQPVICEHPPLIWHQRCEKSANSSILDRVPSFKQSNAPIEGLHHQWRIITSGKLGHMWMENWLD